MERTVIEYNITTQDIKNVLDIIGYIYTAKTIFFDLRNFLNKRKSHQIIVTLLTKDRYILQKKTDDRKKWFHFKKGAYLIDACAIMEIVTSSKKPLIKADGVIVLPEPDIHTGKREIIFSEGNPIPYCNKDDGQRIRNYLDNLIMKHWLNITN